MQRLAFSCWMFPDLLPFVAVSSRRPPTPSTTIWIDEVLVPNASARIAGSSQLAQLLDPTNAAPAFRTMTVS